jgi:hypothetical protein
MKLVGAATGPRVQGSCLALGQAQLVGDRNRLSRRSIAGWGRQQDFSEVFSALQ